MRPATCDVIMSRIIDSLKKIQFKRENGFHRDELSSPVVSSETNPLVSKSNSKANKNSDGKWFVLVVFALFMLVTFGLNLKLFLMMRDYRQERELTIKKVSEIVELLSTKNKVEIESISDNVKELSKQNAQLKEQLQVQSASIENLTKAKNVLYKRMSAFEAELGKLQNGNTPTRQLDNDRRESREVPRSPEQSEGRSPE